MITCYNTINPERNCYSVYVDILPYYASHTTAVWVEAGLLCSVRSFLAQNAPRSMWALAGGMFRVSAQSGCESYVCQRVCVLRTRVCLTSFVLFRPSAEKGAPLISKASTISPIYIQHFYESYRTSSFADFDFDEIDTIPQNLLVPKGCPAF